jgi:hypothetical protein
MIASETVSAKNARRAIPLRKRKALRSKSVAMMKPPVLMTESVRVTIEPAASLA